MRRMMEIVRGNNDVPPCLVLRVWQRMVFALPWDPSSSEWEVPYQELAELVIEELDLRKFRKTRLQYQKGDSPPVYVAKVAGRVLHGVPGCRKAVEGTEK